MGLPNTSDRPILRALIQIAKTKFGLFLIVRSNLGGFGQEKLVEHVSCMIPVTRNVELDLTHPVITQKGPRSYGRF